MENFLSLVKKWIETSTAKQKVVAGVLVFSIVCTIILAALGSGSTAASDPLGSSAYYFASAFIKLIIVLLLIVGCGILLRRWQQSAPGGKTVRQMRVVETVRLSPKQALHLVVVGDQKMLIGATDQGISLISNVEHVSLPVEEAAPQPVLDFGMLLHSMSDPSLSGTQSKK